MNEKYKFYSIGRGSLNLDGKLYYGLDYAITDFMNDLQSQLEQLKIEISARETVCDELQDRINKAVEYIEKHKQKYDTDGSIEDFDELDVLTSPRYLLSLLKGDKE